MRKYFLFVPLLLISLSVFAQLASPAIQIKAAALPKQLRFKGKLMEAWQWRDGSGDNYLLLSTLGPYASAAADADEDSKTIELFAIHYCKKDTGYKTVWRLNDFVKDCPLDMVASFIKGSTSITDLDKDGIAETSIQYKLSCRGDVSPSAMKLIMHEDSVKYALRGLMWLKGAAGEAKFNLTEKDLDNSKRQQSTDEDDAYIQSFGRYENEKDFTKAPASFLQQARKRWLRFAIETN